MAEREAYVRPLSAESAGEAPGRGRLEGRRVLVVGGGQRTFDAETDPVGNGRAMSCLCVRARARLAVADRNLGAAQDAVARATAEGSRAVAIAADITVEADVT